MLALGHSQPACPIAFDTTPNTLRCGGRGTPTPHHHTTSTDGVCVRACARINIRMGQQQQRTKRPRRFAAAVAALLVLLILVVVVMGAAAVSPAAAGGFIPPSTAGGGSRWCGFVFFLVGCGGGDCRGFCFGFGWVHRAIDYWGSVYMYMYVCISRPMHAMDPNPTPHTPHSHNKPHRRRGQQHGQGGGAVVTTRRVPPPPSLLSLLPSIIPLIPTNAAAVWAAAAAAGGGGEESPPPPMGEGGLAAAFGKGKGEL